MKETFLAFLGKTLNIPAEQLADLLYKKSDDGQPTDELNPGALDALLKLDAERVDKLKPDTKQFFDNGYKKAQAELSERWEKLIREKFGITDEVKGDELVAAAFEKAGKKPAMEDEKVKTHPLFLQLEKQYRDDLAAAKAEGEKNLNEYKAGVERQNRLATVHGEVRKLLLAKKPVLSSDPGKAENQIRFFLQNFSEYDYEPLEGGGWLPMKDGKRVENAHKHPVTLEELTNQFANEIFDFQIQDPKGNAGNGNPAGGGNPVRTASPYKTKDEFEEAYWKEQDPAKRSEMAAAFSGGG